MWLRAGAALDECDGTGGASSSMEALLRCVLETSSQGLCCIDDVHRSNASSNSIATMTEIVNNEIRTAQF